MAGIANVNQTQSGVGFSGILNRAGTMKNGFRLSLVSVVDTVEAGVPMALVSIVKKGFYNELAISTADYASVGVAYKAGLRRFYTVYSLGYSFGKQRLWSFGVGFGGRATLSAGFDFQPEIVNYTYYPHDFRNICRTMATHVKPGFVYKFGGKYGISFVPSIYVQHSDPDENGKYYETSPLRAFYEYENSGGKLSIGVGVSVGFTVVP